MDRGLPRAVAEARERTRAQVKDLGLGETRKVDRVDAAGIIDRHRRGPQIGDPAHEDILRPVNVRAGRGRIEPVRRVAVERAGRVCPVKELGCSNVGLLQAENIPEAAKAGFELIEV